MSEPITADEPTAVKPCPAAAPSSPSAVGIAGRRSSLRRAGRTPARAAVLHDQHAPRSWSTSSCVTAAAGRSPIWSRGGFRDRRGRRRARRSTASRRVSRGGGIGVGVAWRTPRPIAVTPDGEPRAGGRRRRRAEDATTALVFDHLSSETLRLAQKATLDYVPMSGESGVRVGVFATDPGVRVVQRYTTDRALVRQAVAGVLPVGHDDEEQKANAPTNCWRGGASSSDEKRTPRRRHAAGIGGAELARNAAAARRARERAAAGPDRAEHAPVDREHRIASTRATTRRRRCSRSCGRCPSMPGRKTIVFFSEGLPVSPVAVGEAGCGDRRRESRQRHRLRGGRKGLRAKSALASARKEIDGFAEERRSQVGSGMDRTEQPLTMAIERVEDTLQARLAHRPGAARRATPAAFSSRDPTICRRRSAASTKTTSSTTCSPTRRATTRSTAGSARFAVKVAPSGHAGLRAQGLPRARARPRRRPPAATTSPALALLDRAPLPNAFPVQPAAFSFPDPARPGLTPGARARLDRVAALRRRRADARPTPAGPSSPCASRDGDGREVQRLSQEYLLSGDAEDVEAAKKGEILFYREPDLAAGRLHDGGDRLRRDRAAAAAPASPR